MIRLTDEEIEQAIGGEPPHDMSYEMCGNMVKAQLKKFVDIVKSDYPETLFLLEDLKFWHDLLEEAK